MLNARLTPSLGVRRGKTSTETGKYPPKHTHLVSFIALNREKKAYSPWEVAQNSLPSASWPMGAVHWRLFGEAYRSPSTSREAYADPSLHRPPDRQKTRRHTRSSACPRFGACRVGRHREHACRPQRELQRQTRQGLGFLPRRVRRAPVQRLVEGIFRRQSGFHPFQPHGGRAPAKADGGVRPVHRRPRVV